MRSSLPTDRRGFSLLEVAVALVLLALLAAAAAPPLAAQLQLRRADDARRQLEEAADVILAFSAAHGRLPCPATEATRGQEAFATGGDAGNGRCATFHAGYLPGAALGLAPLDEAGLVRDPWQRPANRLRYAVHGGTVNGIEYALTRANGMQSASLEGLAQAEHYLFVCVGGSAAGPSGCGPAANQLTRRAAFVLLSPGPNAADLPNPGSDEARNLDGDGTFVARETGADGFDDLLHWGSIHAVIHRLIAAGRLP